MSNILTAPIQLLGQGPAPAGTGAKPAIDATALGSTVNFKAQFDTAIAALAGNKPASGETSVDALQRALQKKISDLLAKGMKLTDIVQQLAATLANQFAAAFAGDPAQIRAQLQSAFASALSPPGTGPPLSIAESASALAQRFRQVAEAAAGVSGETGQSNRLFAGSNSDAANTAGAAPAPSTNSANGPGPTTADSILNAALAAPTLTASPGDGKTVASTAPTAGSNGDTPIGRLLARALDALPSTPNQPASAPAPADGGALPSTTAVNLTATPSVAAALIAAASPNGAANPTPQIAPAVSAAVTPAVSAFLRSFASALNATDGTSLDPAKATAEADGVNSLIAPTLLSSNAPTVSAFMPVQAPFTVDSSNANAPQLVDTPTAPPPVDPNSIVDQVVRGAFLRTDGFTSEVRMKLVPETLGDLSVKLTVSGGSVDAQIVAQTADARDALVAGAAQLTRTLADAGLKLNSFNVDLAGGFAGFQQQQQSSGQPQSPGRRMLIGGVDTAENDDALLAVPSFGPPLLANLNFGSLNYLV